MKKSKDLWSFKGHILVNGLCYERNTMMETYASSKNQAINNLRYRYMKENRLHPVNDIQFLGDFIRHSELNKEELNEQEVMQIDDSGGKYYTPSLFESEYPEPAKLS